MANTQNLVNAQRPAGIIVPYIRESTTEVCASIKDSGLDTVVWEMYRGNDVKMDTVQTKMREFIQQNKPCLFIFDPITKNGHVKDFLFGVNDFSRVENWIRMHCFELKHYSFLITTQIYNPGDGFVGNVITDGDGRMLVKTMHKPGICDQRELSQSKENITPWLDHASIDGFDVAVRRGLLRRADIVRIFETYRPHRGYFEFIYGRQLEKNGIYTTGRERGEMFSFPTELHTSEFNTTSYRILGRLIMG